VLTCFVQSIQFGYSFVVCCLVVAKNRERLAVKEQGSHKFHLERFNLKKLNAAEGKDKYHVEISNRFAELEHLDAEVEINTISEIMRENVNISVEKSLGYYELKKHKPWCDEGCSRIVRSQETS
jgi:hypothetical protein